MADNTVPNSQNEPTTAMLFADLEGYIDERYETQVQEFNKAFKKKDVLIAERNRIIKNLEAQIQEKQQTIEERDRSIAGQNDWIVKMERQGGSNTSFKTHQIIEELKRTIEKRDQTIAQLKAQIKEMEEQGGGNTVFEAEQIGQCWINTMLRIRAPNQEWDDKLTIDHERSAVTYEGAGEVKVTRLFREDATNKDVFEELRELLEKVDSEHHHLFLFAYGESGSGKSSTMTVGLSRREGSSMAGGDDSILKRTVAFLLEKGCSLKVAAVEQYMDKYYDIANANIGDGSSLQGRDPTEKDKKSRQARELVHDPQKAIPSSLRYKGRDMRVKMGSETLSTTSITDAAQVHNLVKLVEKQRSQAETTANRKSSRGHCVITLSIFDNDMKEKGMVTIVDLAGTEEAQYKDQNLMSQSSHLLNELSTVRIFLQDFAANDMKEVPTIKPEAKLLRLLRNSFKGGETTIVVCGFIHGGEVQRGKTKYTLEWLQKLERPQGGEPQESSSPE